LGEYSDKLQSTSGGLSDTELNELQVNPIGRPSVVMVVTTVTPVANMPSALRNSRGSMVCAWEGSPLSLMLGSSQIVG
jgi:hypothetical protein